MSCQSNWSHSACLFRRLSVCSIVLGCYSASCPGAGACCDQHTLATMNARSYTLSVSYAYLQINPSYTGSARFASTMAKFDAETLIKYATQTEKALTAKTLSALQNLSPDVVLHQEAFTLNHDIKGEAEVKKYLQTYFDKYEFDHDTLNYAVNPDTSCSFALSYDKVSSAIYFFYCI